MARTEQKCLLTNLRYTCILCIPGTGMHTRTMRDVSYIDFRFIMLYCTVLYCTVLYCTVLYCTVLHFTVPLEHTDVLLLSLMFF